MEDSNKSLWIDYLRCSITVLVVEHHAALAYTTFANFDNETYINSTHAIVDTKRWIGLDIFVNFNDIFFMALLFLIGGLFLSKSLKRKGIWSFIKDRSLRLLLPFFILGTPLMLLAYFPSFMVSHENPTLFAHIKDFFTNQHWPVGPPWFIWVLFLFNIVFVIINPILQQWRPFTERFLNISKNKPLLLFVFLFGVTWLFYVPIAYKIGAGTWTGFGPFDFQLSRLALYFAYFIIGCLIGNTDFNNSIFSSESFLVKKWWLWATSALLVFSVLTFLIENKTLVDLVIEKKITPFMGWMIYYSIYVASITLSCLAFIAVFRKWIRIENQWCKSLSDSAYLIYLIHFAFVTWLQFLLLDVELSAFLKFSITFILSISLSWMTSILLRKNKIIEKYL